jgi:VWFA-related protein
MVTRALFSMALALHAQDAFRISVDVDLVLLHATVRDHAGQLVAGLEEREIEIWEDGVRQSVRLFRHEDSPVTAGLVVDHSGSMKYKLADVVAGARRFAQASHPLDQMFVVNFNEHVTMPQSSLEQFSSRSDELQLAITTAPPAGKTALYDAIAAALERLQTGSRDKRVLVVFSDGGDNASKHSLADVLRMAALSSAIIYTIGIFEDTDPDKNPGVLKQLAKATGGEAYFPEKFSDIVSVCDRIALEIRQHYTIGFVSSNPAHDGAYRSIRLSAKQAGRKHTVRVRAGYIAGGK